MSGVDPAFIARAYKVIDVHDLDLKVHPAAVRMLERCRVKPPPGSCGRLQHERNAIKVKIGKSLLGPVEPHTEVEHADIECERLTKVTNVELVGQLSHGRSHCP